MSDRVKWENCCMGTSRPFSLVNLHGIARGETHTHTHTHTHKQNKNTKKTKNRNGITCWTQYMQLYIDKCVPQDERSAYNFMCYPFFTTNTRPYGSHTPSLEDEWPVNSCRVEWPVNSSQDEWPVNSNQSTNSYCAWFWLISQSVLNEHTLRVGWVSSTWTINQTHLMFWWLQNHQTLNSPKKKLKDAGKQGSAFTITCAAVAKCSIIHNSATAVHYILLHCCRFPLHGEVNKLVSKLLCLQA